MTKKDNLLASPKKSTSLRLEKKTLKALKIAAIEQDTSIQSIIENLILDFLQNNKNNSLEDIPK